MRDDINSRRILEFLLNGSQDAYHVSVGIGCSSSHASKTLTALRGVGLVTQKGNIYTVTDLGKTIVNADPQLSNFVTQTCSVCGIEKPLSEFHRDTSKPTGHRSRCKDCVSLYHSQRKKLYTENEGSSELIDKLDELISIQLRQLDLFEKLASRGK